MEGFLNFRMRPWLRRLVTRMLAIIPAALTVWFSGEQGTYKLLILSQVLLSLQLPFAVIPLIQFTSNRDRMGEFANPVWVRVLAWTAAAIIVSLNVWLVISTFADWLTITGPWLWLLIAPLSVGMAGLLFYVTFQSWIPGLRAQGAPAVAITSFEVTEPLAGPSYKRILVTLDHTDRDRQAVSHSASLAKAHGAKLVLVHVEEGVTSMLYGAESSTAEVQTGERYFEDIAAGLRAKGFDVELIVRHAPNPSEAIINVAKSVQPDLVVMAAHGHKWYKDLVFGTTINAVRHDVTAPVLIVR
jgi:manganese transport protein